MADSRTSVAASATLVIVCALTCVAILLARGDAAAAPALGAATPTPTETPAPPFGFAAQRVQPAFQQASTGQSSVPITITVENVNNLGAYEVLLTYDSALLDFVAATNQPFLGSTGRSVVCAAPVVSDVGGTLRRLQYGCGTIGSPPPFGPTGNGDLAIIEFAPVAVGLADLVLEPSLADPFGNPIAAVAFGGVIDITPGPTPTPTATNTATPSPTPCPGGVCPTPTPVQCSPTSMRIAPAALNGSPNTVLQVPVIAENACDVGAFEFDLEFDESLLEFSSASPGPFLASSGRPVQCLPPQLDAGAVRITCVTLGPPPPPGASGSGTLVTLHFVAQTLGSGALTLSGTSLLTPDAVAVVHTASGASVSITACDSCVTVTPTYTATPSPSATSTPTVPPTNTPTPCGGPCPTNTSTATPVIATATSTPVLTPIDLRIDPAAYEQTEGNSITVGVTASNAVDLGAFSFVVAYDSAVLSYQSIVVGPFLGSTGRSVFCDPQVGGSSVRFSCSSLGGEPPGPAGSGELAAITFVAAAPGGSALTIAEALFTRRNAEIIPTGALQHGTATITACPASCPTATPTAVGSPSATQTPGGIAVVGVAPPSLTVSPGTTFTVDVTVDDVNNLGAFEFVFGHNQGGFVDFVDVRPGPFLGSTGRPVFCPTPTVNALTVRFSCGTLGSSALGPSGDGVLVTLTLHANDVGLADPFGITSALLSDPLANNIPLTLAPAGTLTSLPPTPTATPTILTGGGFSMTRRSDPSAPAGSRAERDSRGNMPPEVLLAVAGAISLAAIYAGLRRRPAPARLRHALLALAVGVVAVPAIGALKDLRADSGPSLNAQPSAANLFIGAPPLAVQQRVSGVPAEAEVAGFDLVVRYDANLVDLTIEEGGFLGSTDREVACTATDVTFYERRFSCVSTGAAAYPSGSGTLATFTIAPVADIALWLPAAVQNGGELVLDIVAPETRLIDASGATILFASIEDGAVTVRSLEGDVNNDCTVDVIDHQELAARYPSSAGEAAYSELYDLEPASGDGDIDIHDVQFVFGRNGSRCDAPVPAQPPGPTLTPVDADQDDDGVYDAADNCPSVANPDQLDADVDNLGDACEALYGADPAVADSDRDGCQDGREARTLTYAVAQGGDRSPGNSWDFFDVPAPALSVQNPSGVRNNAVSLADVGAVLAYVGTIDEGPSNAPGFDYDSDHNANGVDDGAEYDRAPSNTPGKPWRSSAPNDAVSLQDVGVALAQVGHSCAA